MPLFFTGGSQMDLALVPAHVLAISPDLSLLLTTLGVCLVFLELNRPGWILPATIGLALVLLCLPSLLAPSHSPLAVLALLLSIGLSLCHLWYHYPSWVSAAVPLAMIFSLRFFISGSSNSHVHWFTAIASGSVIGAASTFLAGAARRARDAKRLQPRSR